MGGIGSGRHTGIQSPTLNDIPKFSVDRLSRLSKLRPGWKGTIPLFPSGAVSVDVFKNHILLAATKLGRFGPARNLSIELALERVPCHLGGHRGSLVCPGSKWPSDCGKGVRVLYIGSDRALCRDCIGLHYRSQQYDQLGGLYDRLHFLRGSLGFTPRVGRVLPPRPPNMQERTYHQVAEEIIWQWAKIQEQLGLEPSRLSDELTGVQWASKQKPSSRK